jgi:hypothetical protein
VGRVRESHRLRQRVRIGAPDPRLTGVSGMVAVTELVSRLGVIKLLDAAIGPIKARGRGCTGGELLVGMAAAQLSGEDFLVGLDRWRADAAGQVLAPVAGLSSTTAAGLARRFSDAQWQAVETGRHCCINTKGVLTLRHGEDALCVNATVPRLVTPARAAQYPGRPLQPPGCCASLTRPPAAALDPGASADPAAGSPMGQATACPELTRRPNSPEPRRSVDHNPLRFLAPTSSITRD